MKTIYKYPLPSIEPVEIPMPRGARVLCIQTQDDHPCLWVAVESTAPTETRRFHIRGTGHPLGDVNVNKYVGTFQLMGGALVFHVFEGRN